VLYAFTGGADGDQAFAALTSDSAGNLYGTTHIGGTANAGVVFKLDTSGQETVLYNFTGRADGGYPYSGVILDSAGNLYGTTPDGGAAGYGVVYKVNTSGKETVLYNFCSLANCEDGAYPEAGVIRDSAGNLYGTTDGGGAAGMGVVYKLDPVGQETVLYTFCSLANCADGSQTYAGVIRDSSGNLYGTTQRGGTGNAGVVFELNTAVVRSRCYSFYGSGPQAGVVSDSSGNLYGTTVYGGKESSGVVFKLVRR